MGQTNYLTGSGQRSLNNLGEVIEELQDTSLLFVQRWHRRDFQEAGNVTLKAMRCFDYIVGEMMRSREGHKRTSTYENSSFQREMRKYVGKMIRPVSNSDHVNITRLGPGNGVLPTNLGTIKPITYEKTLNKIKHRSNRHANFRIASGRHIYIVCPENLDGTADSIVEFDVQDFCDHSRIVSRHL